MNDGNGLTLNQLMKPQKNTTKPRKIEIVKSKNKRSLKNNMNKTLQDG